MINKPEVGIEKTYIQEEIYPDIILMPTYGSNGAMWQEIEGRKRASHARFIFPIFAETDMEDNFIRVCGRFRWELCRTIQGAAWNDVKVKSLTSEYVDYIQFYRKNRALSEEKKEKLKMQIQKGRGNTKEVFVIDYLLWIKNESTGSLRLNKVAREVLASYCPFIKSLRDKVQSQPLFEEAMAKFNRERAKKVKELDLRFVNLLQLHTNYDNLKNSPGLFSMWETYNNTKLPEQKHDSLEDAMVTKDVFFKFKEKING